jgi:hypothetical protein
MWIAPAIDGAIGVHPRWRAESVMPRLHFSDPDAHPAVDVLAGYPLAYDAALLTAAIRARRDPRY